ncbi:peptidoglycan-binding protein [Streptomyces canus]|uniref:peptidoglycan-binding domain-containing protein n=1 Tax=Streptomyces canus TaxID=58343 RepID=UPI0036B58520
MKRAQLAAGIVGTLTAATLALSTSPASASGTYSGRAYVYGAGDWYDDWTDEGILSMATNTKSNATCLWQKILWADGYLSYTSDIDGDFGQTTAWATVNWQVRLNLENIDGVVGKETFKAAARIDDPKRGLKDGNLDGAVDSYVGFVHTINVTRDSDGRYHFYDGNGDARIAGYDYRTCS